MKTTLLLTALLVLGGCGSSAGGGDRGEPAAPADLGKPVTKDTLDTMPPQARKAAQQSIDAGKAMNEQMNKRYGQGH